MGKEKNIPITSDDSAPVPGGENPCAREVLRTVPVIMRDIIRHMQTGRDPGMSVPQFRVMVYIVRHPGASLAQLANFLGQAPPSASKLVDALVRQNLIERRVDSADRRRITLNISPQGQAAHDHARAQTLNYLTSRLNDLTDAQRRTITRAMSLLYKTLAPPEFPTPESSPECPPESSR
jgi:DNA-binding MarR family transcriptional regulator